MAFWGLVAWLLFGGLLCCLYGLARGGARGENGRGKVAGGGACGVGFGAVVVCGVWRVARLTWWFVWRGGLALARGVLKLWGRGF